MIIKEEKGRYREDYVIADLRRLGIKVQNGAVKSIDLTKRDKPIGIKTLGKIDYLNNYRGYTVYF